VTAAFGSELPSTPADAWAAQGGPSGLFGRGDEVSQLVELLSEHGPGGARLVNLHGTPGVGATSVLEAAVGVVRADFETVLQLDVAREGGLEAWAGSVRERLRQARDRGERVRGAAPRVRGRSLVVVDQADAAALRQPVEECLFREPGTTFVVVSAVPLRAPRWHRVALGPLPLPSACELFVAAANTSGSLFQPDPEEERLVAEICEALGRNALAVGAAASRLQVMSLTALARRLAEDRAALDLVSPTEAGMGSVRRSLS